MDQGIEFLEQNIAAIETRGIGDIVSKYRQLYPSRPLRQLVEDIQQRAMVYTNIIDQLKLGKTAAEIKERFDELDLVPPNTLPNPEAIRLLNFCFNKLSQCGKALVEIVHHHGLILLTELDFRPGDAVSLGVDLSVPPGISLAVHYDV